MRFEVLSSEIRREGLVPGSEGGEGEKLGFGEDGGEMDWNLVGGKVEGGHEGGGGTEVRERGENKTPRCQLEVLHMLSGRSFKHCAIYILPGNLISVHVNLNKYHSKCHSQSRGASSVVAQMRTGYRRISPLA